MEEHFPVIPLHLLSDKLLWDLYGRIQQERREIPQTKATDPRWAHVFDAYDHLEDFLNQITKQLESRHTSS